MDGGHPKVIAPEFGKKIKREGKFGGCSSLSWGGEAYCARRESPKGFRRKKNWGTDNPRNLYFSL